MTVNRSELNDALGQDLEALALTGSTICPTTGCALVDCAAPPCPQGDLNGAMSKAFQATVSKLTTQLGSDPTTWTWGRVHQRVIENLAQVTGLNYGPRPDGGDANTPLAAPDFPSTHGPSWRIVVDWGAGTFQAIYPGGQSENPASAWYSDRVDKWFNGKYAAMLTAGQAATTPGNIAWHLDP